MIKATEARELLAEAEKEKTRLAEIENAYVTLEEMVEKKIREAALNGEHEIVTRIGYQCQEPGRDNYECKPTERCEVFLERIRKHGYNVTWKTRYEERQFVDIYLEIIIKW